jgi:cardiolipin synthase
MMTAGPREDATASAMFHPSDTYQLTEIVTAVTILAGLAASAHVLLRKRDSRAAVAWIGLIWLSPIVGVLLYVLLGINRINRRARSLRRDQPRSEPLPAAPCTPELMWETLGHAAEHLDPLSRLVGRATGRPLLAGNTVEPLLNGDQAYPAMIRAIDHARRSIALSSYIFNDDRAGSQFVEALARAAKRGLAIRVLIDDVGARYDLPTVFRKLRRNHIPYGRFMPTLTPAYLPYWNLRNHRKILVADGRVGFTGGMNIDQDYLHEGRPRHPKQDLHFAVSGPVVADLMRTFSDDWVFSTGELLGGDAWFPELEPVGGVLARGVPAGPDEADNSIRKTILGALGCARSTVTIVTPYFVPDPAVVAALEVAAMSGVVVDVVLPKQSNLAAVHWATTVVLGQLLESGVRVWHTPPPFDHSKLVIVDGAWSFIGSANWDARSLRLNFEFNVECYDPAFASSLAAIVSEKLQEAEPVTLAQIEGRGLLRKLRDAIAALFIPYL